MESKIKSTVKNIFESNDKKIKIAFAIGIAGILLIFASDMFSGDNSSNQTVQETSTDYVEYVDNLETKLANIISSIDGVGKCEVMITLENSTESIYATDSDTNVDDSSTSKKDEYVIYDSDDGETPVLIKENFPKVQGVVVVCEGGDNVELKEKIIDSVTSLFNISTNRISVSKIKS